MKEFVNMKHICAQPATQHYAWQIDVMLHSFEKNGVMDVDVVLTEQENDYFELLKKKYPWVNFFFYADTRKDKSYPPTTKAHLLAKHLKETGVRDFFLTDCDIVLTKPLKLEKLKHDDVWYLSDTISYLGYNYILSKGRRVLDLMLNVFQIDEDLVKTNQPNSGGAQYLFKDVDPEYFEEVEAMSNRLYKAFLNDLKENPKEKNPIQKWTAEMWAFLYVAWKNGKQTKVHKDLDFCFATDTIKRWDDVSIYHNAGVTHQTEELFFKGNYINEIPPLDLNLLPNRTSYKYYELIKQAL